jgi:TRAP-type C4-dicarboxylate transport system permease large subunit
MTMVIILGGILSGRVHRHRVGVDRGAVGVLRHHVHLPRLQWRDLPKLMHRTVKTVSIVMILIGFAASFGYIMTLMQIPAQGHGTLFVDPVDSKAT